MKTPLAVLAYCRNLEQTEDQARTYILEQLAAFKEQPLEAEGEAPWLALKRGSTRWIQVKLGASRAGADAAIRWAYICRV